jgi:amidase
MFNLTAPTGRDRRRYVWLSARATGTMDHMAEPHELSALEQGAAVRRGELSPVDLVEHYLARIDAHAGELGAFVTVTADQARAAARAIEAAPRSAGGEAPRSPVAGVPTAIKDLTLTAGVRTTFGSAAFADFVPGIDADVVTLMRQAGLVSLGKTATSEFGASLYCETELGPPARNPWRLDCTAGGSSGGAAAAVAAGLVPFAQGNDGGGSLRIPASICGVVGFKPSRGLVSNGPLGFGGFGLPTNGPIARTVADAAALLDILSAPVPGEPYPSPARPAAGFLDAVRRPAAYLPAGRPVRVGRYRTPILADVMPAPEVVEVWERTSDALAGLGYEVIDVDAPFGPDAEPFFATLWGVLSLAPVPPEAEARLLPLTRWLRESGRQVGAEQLVTALNELQVRIRRHARTAQWDVLLSPVLAGTQAPVGWFASAPTPAEDFARQASFSPYCASYNISGQPAVSLPVGQDRAGAPIGMMLAAAGGDDALLMAVSAQLEEAMPWAGRHPPVWSAPAVRIP